MSVAAPLHRSRPLRGAALLLIVVAGALAGCAGGYSVGVGYGYDYDDGYYYDAPDDYYGDWGPGYLVGPPGYFGYPHDRGHFHGGPRPYRPAPAGRPVPGIPQGPRGGGVHGGGFHGGGRGPR